MKDSMPNFETVEVFPTIEDVESLIKLLLDKGTGFDETKKVEDEKGLYRLDIMAKGEDGLPVEYSYRRDGSFVIEGEEKKRVPAIDIGFFDEDEMPIGGSTVKFVNGEWE